MVVSLCVKQGNQNRPVNIDSRQGGARKKERRQSHGEFKTEQEDSGFVKVQKKRSASKK